MDYTNIQLETFLDDFENNSEIIFLEDAKQTNELFEVAKAKGILAEGSRDLAVFKAIYTFADKQNENGVTIPEEELLRKLPTVIGKPVTLEHVRRFVIGFVIDYRYLAKEKTAIIYGIIFKNCFKGEWEKAVKLLKEHKLGVSSEIWSPKSKRIYTSEKEYKINDIEFAGCTIVFTDKKNKPAFEDATVLEMAKKNYEEQEELIFAMLNKEKIETLSCGKCKDGKECNLCESLLTATQEVVTPVVPPVNTQPNKMKIICQHCSHNFEHLFIQGQNNPINCPNCQAILDQSGKIIYPPQIKNFDLSCQGCQARNNWLTLSSKDNEAKVECNSCHKQYILKFKNIPEEYYKLLEKFTFLRTGKIGCIQCGTYNNFEIPSSQKKVEVKCKKCGLPFSFDIEEIIKRDIEKVEDYKEIQLNKEDKEMIELEKAKQEITELNKKLVEKDLETSKLQEKEKTSKLITKKLLRKAVSKNKAKCAELKKKEEEVAMHKAKIEKFGKGIKKLAGKTRELQTKTKEKDIELSKAKKEIEDIKNTNIETAKKVEPVLKTATTNVGDKSKDDGYYAKKRAEVDKHAFGWKK
jgi:hypothetical protein